MTDRIRKFARRAIATLGEAGRSIASAPASLYAVCYVWLKLNRVCHLAGLRIPLQERLLPSRLYVSQRLMSQPYWIRTSDILWGGRPAAGRSMVGNGRGCGWIFDGDWDRVDKRDIDAYLRDYIYSRTVLQLFADGLPFQETDQYREMVRVISAGDYSNWKARGCRNEADIERYFQCMKEIFEAIRTQGYKSQAELGSRRWFDEIKVFIDREGEIHKLQGAGHHRLAMARVLRVSRIPVIVLGVHRSWALAAGYRHKADIVTSVDREILEHIACG
jgi:hypothetical protein